MARTFTDFSGLTPPAITGFSTYSLSGSWSWETSDVSVSGATGGKVMRSSAGGSGSNANMAFVDAVGSVDGTTTAVEVLVRYKTRSTEGAPGALGPAILMGSTSDDRGYAVGFPSSTALRIMRLDTSGNPYSTLGSDATITAVANDTWYCLRFRRDTDGTFKAKHWAGDVADEPVGWTHDTGTVNTSYTSGYVGLLANSSTQEKDYDLIGVGVGESAPSAGYATPTITDAGDEDFLPGETGINITGTNFGAVQGSGKVYLSPTDNASDSGRVEQTVTGWSDTSVVFTCVPGSLARATNLYLFVVNGGGLSNAAGRVVQIPATGPTISSISKTTFHDGETGIVITGTGFGATPGTYGTVKIAATNSVTGTPAALQTDTAWSDTSITFTAVKGALSFLTPGYLFVVTDSLESNSSGYPVEIEPHVYVQDSVVDLDGNAVALNGEALLIWRSRPSNSKQNPDQVITLGSIPTGVLNVEINRGSLAVNDPVWCMLVDDTGNNASAKRIVPVYS
ncbi:MAG: hypothetical protein DYH20_01055 [Gammaproteobacteria bacterium PRO9]|nr:hypothetical protein [Gammaproteobacteria bacterium PRO9]